MIIKINIQMNSVKNCRSSALTSACLRVNIGRKDRTELQWTSTIPTELQQPYPGYNRFVTYKSYPEQTTIRLGCFVTSAIHDSKHT
jgi:hypothetical protein